MTVFEAIKNFKEFQIGDKVIWNREEVTIIGLPTFQYRIYYGNGDFTDYQTDDLLYGSQYKTQTTLGYLVRDNQGEEFRINILAELIKQEDMKN